MSIFVSNLGEIIKQIILNCVKLINQKISNEWIVFFSNQLYGIL